jgi:quercetin dioxygenase-like cupin family protein
MDIKKLSNVESETIDGPVQESKANKKEGIVGEFNNKFITVSEVTFQPGERTNLHYHTYGQVLYITNGPGRVGTEDDEYKVEKGDVVFFEPGEVHWHGTGETAESNFSHLVYVIRDEVGEDTIAIKETNE